MGRSIWGRLKKSLNKRLSRPQKPRDVLEDMAVLMRAAARDKPIIFDVGANVGSVSKGYAAKFPSARIHAFEPTESVLTELHETAAQLPQIQVVEKAVSDKIGTQTFHINGQAATNSLLPRPTSGRKYYPAEAETVRTIEVQTTTLDSYCAAQKLDHVTLLKMDIQGAELAALAGAADLLRQGAIDMVYTEAMFIPHYQDQPLLTDLWQHLLGHGYALFGIYDIRHGDDGQIRVCDALFLSPQFAAKAL